MREILSAAPEAIATAKELLKKVSERPVQDTIGLTADTIAARRASAEGQEGMRAFWKSERRAGMSYRIPIVECLPGS